MWRDDIFAFREAPVPHRRVGRDAGTEQRRGPGETQISRDTQYKGLVHDDAIAIAAISENLVGAELLEILLAIRA